MYQYKKQGVLVFLLVSAVSATAPPDNLRGTDNLKKILKDENVCEPITSEPTCLSNAGCSWCKAGAVPDECVPTDLASGLPKSVFMCEESPSASVSSKTVQNTPLLGGMTRRIRKRVFNFVSGKKHTFDSSEVKGDVCDPASKSFSGYMDVEGSKFDASGEDKHLFYWFFEKRGMENVEMSDKKDIPLIVWLTGGPGCSSTLALLTENGPCKVSEDGESTEINPHSWTEAAHMLWLDQPAGVGFSYGAKEDDKNEEMVGEDAYYFLQSFVNTYPEYASNPLFIVGESYGGHYAPAIAHRIFLGNQAITATSSSSLKKLNLSGVAVGNGMTEPKVQFEYYAEMAMYNSHNIKTVSEADYEGMKEATPHCLTLIDGCNDSLKENFYCQAAYQYCMNKVTGVYYQSGLNPYDIRLECGDNPLCYDFSNVENFLNLESTRKSLHVSQSSPQWQSCNNAINRQFTLDWMKGFSKEVSEMLNGGIPHLIYAGDVDFICNYMGNRAWTDELDWKYKNEYSAAEEHDWNENSGLSKTAEGLTFLQVYDAGHMVPTDKPEVALKMIEAFVTGEKF